MLKKQFGHISVKNKCPMGNTNLKVSNESTSVEQLAYNMEKL